MAADQMLPGACESGSALIVDRVVLIQRDARYDHASEETRLAVEVHLRDGSTVRTELVLEPAQLYAVGIQVERALSARERARSVVPR
ncbi:hypothetical protein [Streptomyces sp. UNOC14_S4]|uniref:hypothetical protein n=1 Tax=Streptomyces sp. UNOC14_S4 TaxID=2872340 RepID=UPI001E5F8ECC|nr:hypothetical protein [Streptomyces sp. UNOC14_S4]MCC3770566.1 hypothetical protein [Streptomyces sp. UNOC14_S4]